MSGEPWAGGAVEPIDMRLRGAARAGDAQLVADLMEGGADPLAGADGCMVAFNYAALGGHADCVELMLPYFARRTGGDLAGAAMRRAQAVGFACSAGSAECVRLLADAESARVRNSLGWTPMMMAAAEGQEACMAALLGMSDPLARGLRGESALMLAARSGSEACVARLLPFSDVGATDDSGYGAAMVAERYGNDRVAALIRGYRLAQEEATALEGSSEPPEEAERRRQARRKSI